MLDHSTTEPTAIVNLSASGRFWSTLSVFEPIQTAFLNLSSRDNLLLVQSAGNGSEDACSWGFGDESKFTVGSPEYIAASKVLIVGGSDENDGRWTCVTGDENCGSSNSGPNIGTCLDLFAPASHIVSAWNGDESSTDPNYIGIGSPNSMACVQGDSIFADGFESGDASIWSSTTTE